MKKGGRRRGRKEGRREKGSKRQEQAMLVCNRTHMTHEARFVEVSNFPTLPRNGPQQLLKVKRGPMLLVGQEHATA